MDVVVKPKPKVSKETKNQDPFWAEVTKVMTDPLGTNSEDLDRLVCQRTVENLKKTPNHLAEFLLLVKTGKDIYGRVMSHKKHYAYRQAKSELVLPYAKGRLTPDRSGKLSGGSAYQSDRTAMAFNRANSVHYPSLRLDLCKTDKQRIDKILKSDIPADIKAELLAPLLKAELLA